MRDFIHLRLAIAQRHYKETEGASAMKTTHKTVESDEVTEGSGHVFADLGLSNPDPELTKARLTDFLTVLDKDVEIGVTPARKGTWRNVDCFRITPGSLP